MISGTSSQGAGPKARRRRQRDPSRLYVDGVFFLALFKCVARYFMISRLHFSEHIKESIPTHTLSTSNQPF